MLENTPVLFYVLLYVMFDKTYSSDNEKAELALELGGINNTTVEQNVRHLDAFLFVGADRKIEIKQKLLIFSLFKFCANHPRFSLFF